jgi:hypothetical protein
MLCRMYCGTARNPASIRSQYDHQAFDWRDFPRTGTVQELRDFRLGLTARILEAIQRGRALALQNMGELRVFRDEVDDALDTFSHARNAIMPFHCEFVHVEPVD